MYGPVHRLRLPLLLLALLAASCAPGRTSSDYMAPLPPVPVVPIVTGADQLLPLPDGPSAFSVIVDALGHARTSIDLELYEFQRPDLAAFGYTLTGVGWYLSKHAVAVPAKRRRNLISAVARTRWLASEAARRSSSDLACVALEAGELSDLAVTGDAAAGDVSDRPVDRFPSGFGHGRSHAKLHTSQGTSDGRKPADNRFECG